MASDLLPRGRFFLQTMVFGPKMIPAEQLSLDAAPASGAWYFALMTMQFPGSWQPYGAQQLVRAVAPHFRLVASNTLCFERRLPDHVRLVFAKV